MNRSGFTLIELMIAVVVIGLLAATALPKFTPLSNGAKQAEAATFLKHLCVLAEANMLTENAWTATEASLRGWTPPGESYFHFTLAGSVASATTEEAGLRDQSMDCVTKQLQ